MVGFGEAPRGHPASPKSPFVARSRRLCRRERATRVDSWRDFVPPNLPESADCVSPDNFYSDKE